MASASLQAIPLDRELAYEQLVLLDGQYNEIGRADGEASAVSEDGFTAAQANNARYVTHNHPESVPLSATDIRNIVAMGRAGIEARCRSYTPEQRQTLNKYLTQIRERLMAHSQELIAQGASKRTATQLMQAGQMINVIDTFMANPTATQWSFIATNSLAGVPAFRNAGIIEKKINDGIAERITQVGALVRGGKIPRSEEQIVRAAYSIVIQQAVLNDVLSQYNTLTHGVVFN